VQGGVGAEFATSQERLGLAPGALLTLLVVAGLGCCVAMAMPQMHIVAYCGDLGYGPARGAEMLSLIVAARNHRRPCSQTERISARIS